MFFEICKAVWIRALLYPLLGNPNLEAKLFSFLFEIPALRLCFGFHDGPSISAECDSRLAAQQETPR